MRLHNVSTGRMCFRDALVLAALAMVVSSRVSAEEPVKKPVRHNDLEFAEVGGQKLLLDLYLPATEAAAGKAPPLVLYIHGGSWIRGSRKECPVSWLTAHGYAVASTSYRFTDKAIFPAQIHDVKGAVRWLRANASKHGYDPARVGVAGSSAGGHLAALLGTSGDVKELEGDVGGNLDQSSKVLAVVDFYGPADFVLRSETQDSSNKKGSSTFGLLGGPVAEHRELARLASPAFHVSAGDPPLLIFHGDEDKTVLLNQSERLRDAAKEAQLDVTLHVIPKGGHGGPQFSSDENKERVKAFFDAHLKGTPSKP